MTGQYTINEADIYTTYGLVFKVGTLDALMEPSRRKESYTYSWRDQHGSDRDVEETFLESKNISISALIVADSLADFKTKYAAFKAFVAGGEYFILESTPTEISWKLIYDSVSSFKFERLANTGQLVASFMLNVIDDFPNGYEVA